MSASTNRLTVETLREMGYRAKIVQVWNHAAKIRQDLFGVGDVLGIHAQLGRTLLVQACGETDRAKHVRTLLESEWVPDLIASGWNVELWSWRKRRHRWEVRRWSAIDSGVGVALVELTPVRGEGGRSPETLMGARS